MAEDEGAGPTPDADDNAGDAPPDEVEDWSGDEPPSDDDQSDDDDEGEKEKASSKDDTDEEDDEESEDDDEDDVLKVKDVADLVERYKLQGKSDREVLKIIARKFHDINNSAAKTAKGKKELENLLERTQEELDELRNAKPEEAEDKNEPKSTIPEVERAQAKVEKLEARQKELQSSLKQFTNDCAKSHRRVIEAQALAKAADDDSRPARERALREAIADHNENVRNYESAEEKLTDKSEKLEEAQDQLESAKRLEKQQQEERAKQDREKATINRGWMRTFVQIGEEWSEKLGVSAEDHEEFMDDLQNEVITHLRRLSYKHGPNHPAQPLEKVIPEIIQRKQKLAGYLHASKERKVFAEESEKTRKTIKAIRPPTPIIKKREGRERPEDGSPAQPRRSSSTDLRDQVAKAQAHARKHLPG